MRRLLFATCLAIAPLSAFASAVEGVDWHLRAMDGQRVEVSATFRIEADGTVGGQAPCNRYGTTNAAALPAVKLGPIAATRMACDRLDLEQAFFDILAGIDMLALGGDQALILTGPEGHSLEFVRDPMLDPAACMTCTPPE